MNSCLMVFSPLPFMKGKGPGDGIFFPPLLQYSISPFFFYSIHHSIIHHFHWVCRLLIPALPHLSTIISALRAYTSPVTHHQVGFAPLPFGKGKGPGDGIFVTRHALPVTYHPFLHSPSSILRPSVTRHEEKIKREQIKQRRRK
jgi:hypothetical protein